MHNPMTYILIGLVILIIGNSIFAYISDVFGFESDTDNSIVVKLCKFFEEHDIIYCLYKSITIVSFFFGILFFSLYFIFHYKYALYKVTPFVEITENIEADRPYKYKVTSKKIVEIRSRSFWDESWIEDTQLFHDINLKIIYTDDVSSYR